jgi:hypothetical protein
LPIKIVLGDCGREGSTYFDEFSVDSTLFFAEKCSGVKIFVCNFLNRWY